MKDNAKIPTVMLSHNSNRYAGKKKHRISKLNTQEMSSWKRE